MTSVGSQPVRPHVKLPSCLGGFVPRYLRTQVLMPTSTYHGQAGLHFAPGWMVWDGWKGWTTRDALSVNDIVVCIGLSSHKMQPKLWLGMSTQRSTVDTILIIKAWVNLNRYFLF